MNRFLKYILFFLLGFIIYLLINNKLIEGYENELTLLFNILKERTDIGCDNYRCEDDYEINPHTRWEQKLEYKDENSLLCNNSPEYSIVSLLNTGNKCNNELCCDDKSCEKKYFSEGYSCFGRDRYPGKLCRHDNVEDCFISCCNQNENPGPSKTIYDNIKEFRDKLNENTIQEFGTGSVGRCGTEYNIVYSEISEGTITGLDLRNYIYFSLLDLDHIRNTQQEQVRDISTNINLINYHDFECIHVYITILYNEIINQNAAQDASEKVQNIKSSLLNNDIFTGNTRLKIKGELLGEKTVSEYVDQLVEQDYSHDLYSQRFLGVVSNSEINRNFLNFIKFYTNDDISSQSDSSPDDIQNNTYEDLIKNFKLVVLMIANPIINDQGQKTPLDILLLGSTQNSYKTRQIDATELKYIM
jgi:hypothetical protein